MKKEKIRKAISKLPSQKKIEFVVFLRKQYKCGSYSSIENFIRGNKMSEVVETSIVDGFQLFSDQ